MDDANLYMYNTRHDIHIPNFRGLPLPSPIYKRKRNKILGARLNEMYGYLST